MYMYIYIYIYVYIYIYRQRENNSMLFLKFNVVFESIVGEIAVEPQREARADAARGRPRPLPPLLPPPPPRPSSSRRRSRRSSWSAGGAK